jgi:hypothetical protein
VSWGQWQFDPATRAFAVTNVTWLAAGQAPWLQALFDRDGRWVRNVDTDEVRERFDGADLEGRQLVCHARWWTGLFTSS